jgi:murein DD-endopeptidase MepM/ murein hydrolase activator NlpD
MRRQLSLSQALSGLFNIVLRRIRAFQWLKAGKIFKETFQNIHKKIPWKSPPVLGGFFVFFILIGGLVYALTPTSAVAVIVNGKQLGLVADLNTGKNLVATALQELNQSTGTGTDDQVTYTNVRVNRAVYLQLKLSPKDLAAKLNLPTEAFKLESNGSVIAILPSAEDVDKVLQAYQDYYVKPDKTDKVVSVGFAEKVTIEKAEVQLSQIDLPDQVLKMLIDGKTTTKNYTVQSGDSWWLIARKNNMLTNEVLTGNPGATPDTKLQPGQIVKLVNIVPYLTVVAQGTHTTTETIPYVVVTQTDNSLASGQTKIIKNGTNGSKSVTYSYEQKNGQDVSEQVLNETVIKAPVNEVIAKGPTRRVGTSVAVSRGNGEVSGLSWPLQGRITSPYGPRWGGFHTGIDIAGSIGTPYYAAAAGTVVAAGWGGAYGNMILIDHGNGVETRYAHSSKLLVSVGTHVSKGQKIGLVGMTGNATGPHLHFEVIKNGATVNPENYLP